MSNTLLISPRTHSFPSVHPGRVHFASHRWRSRSSTSSELGARIDARHTFARASGGETGMSGFWRPGASTPDAGRPTTLLSADVDADDGAGPSCIHFERNPKASLAARRVARFPSPRTETRCCIAYSVIRRRWWSGTRGAGRRRRFRSFFGTEDGVEADGRWR